MHRLWLWPLVIVGIGLSSWAIVVYGLPKWLAVVPAALVGLAAQLDLRLSGKDQSTSETVLTNVSGDGDLGLNRGSQIAIGAISALFALVMFAWASTAPGNVLFNSLPGLFCVLVAAACLLPSRYRGYCGDLIAVLVLALAGWFLITTPWWGTNKSPLGFAAVFGGLSLAYLAKRYARYFGNRNT